MRLALCAEVIDHLDFAAQCAFAKAVGYEGLEIEPQRLGDMPHLLPTSRRAELKRIAADHGIQITGFHSLLYVPPGLSITSADATVRRQTLDVIERLCHLCSELGGSYIVHGSADQRRLSSQTPQEERQRGIEAFSFGASVAAGLDLTYIIEPIRPARTQFINTIAEAAAIAGGSGIASLATMLDCLSANEAESEPLPAVLNRWLPTGLIAHVHLNDPNRLGPGQGDMKFAEILETLQRHSYDRWISVEPFVFEPSGEAVAARAAGYVRGLLEAINGGR